MTVFFNNYWQPTCQVAKWNGTKVSVKILDRDSYSDPDSMYWLTTFLSFFQPELYFFACFSIIFNLKLFTRVCFTPKSARP